MKAAFRSIPTPKSSFHSKSIALSHTQMKMKVMYDASGVRFQAGRQAEEKHSLKANRHVLATDEWLRVEGTNEIFALGDYGMINQRRVMSIVDWIEQMEVEIKKTNKSNLKSCKLILMTLSTFQECSDLIVKLDSTQNNLDQTSKELSNARKEYKDVDMLLGTRFYNT